MRGRVEGGLERWNESSKSGFEQFLVVEDNCIFI